MARTAVISPDGADEPADAASAAPSAGMVHAPRRPRHTAPSTSARTNGCFASSCFILFPSLRFVLWRAAARAPEKIAHRYFPYLL